MESESSSDYDKDLHIRILGSNGVGLLWIVERILEQTGKTELLQCFCNDSVSIENEGGTGLTIFHFEELNIRIRVSEREKVFIFII